MAVQDIEYTSAEHVLEEIHSFHVNGGSPLGRAAAHAFRLICEQETFADNAALIARCMEVSADMRNFKPTMAPVQNACQIIEDVLEAYRDAPMETLKAEVCKACSGIIRYSSDAMDKVAEYGAALIQNGDVIFMHGGSSTLTRIYCKAAEQGKNFTVICTEARPHCENRETLRILESIGMDAKYIADDAMYAFLPQADYVLLGADTICTDGSVANMMGTAMAARLAADLGKPVYIASDLFKTDIRTAGGYRPKLERRSGWGELLPKEEFGSFQHLEVINQVFDMTPARDIRALVCEYGVIPPTMVPHYWEKLEQSIRQG